MGDESNQPAGYLEALAEINRSLAHEMRSHLGNLTLHVGLIGEMLKRSTANRDDPARAQWERYAPRIESDAQQVVRAVERILMLTRPSAEAETSFDARTVIVELEALIAPYLLERQLKWSATLPSAPVPARGRRDAVDRLLLTAVVDAARATPAGGRLEVRLEAAPPDATVRIESGAPRGPLAGRDVALPLRVATT